MAAVGLVQPELEAAERAGVPARLTDHFMAASIGGGGRGVARTALGRGGRGRARTDPCRRHLRRHCLFAARLSFVCLAAAVGVPYGGLL
jgi:hypothetical protein